MYEIVTTLELSMLQQIFLSMASRCHSGVNVTEAPEEIEREIFYKYIMMQGLWAQRFYQQFLGNMSTETAGEEITFEKFLMLNYKYLRAGPESFDRMIFEIFDLEQQECITEKNLSRLLLTLPKQAVISGLNAELVDPSIDTSDPSKC